MNHVVSASSYNELSADVRRYLDSALADNTLAAYRIDVARFIGWGGCLPCTADMLVSYLAAHAETHAVTTLGRWTVSISRAHTLSGHPDPSKSDLVRLTLRGIRRTRTGKQKQAAALLKDDLLTILRQMPATPKGSRDGALLILGFAAGLRRSEIVGLDIADVAFVPQGMTITLRQSKTDRLREGRTVAIPFGRTAVCPVQIVREWLALLPSHEGPLFTSIAKGGNISAQRLSDRAVADLVKHYAGKIGLDAASFSGHSLRAGLVSSCAMAGVSSWIIRRTTGHQSEEMIQRYVRPVEAFTYNASGLLF